MGEWYETEDNYSSREIAEWRKFLDREIGTDFEVNESASGELDEYYIVILDLEEPEEIEMIRAFENKMRPKVAPERKPMVLDAKVSGLTREDIVSAVENMTAMLKKGYDGVEKHDHLSGSFEFSMRGDHEDGTPIEDPAQQCEGK